MWQTYRDRDTSTYYFVYDNTRDDRLGIVVVDVRKYKIVLTDKPNSTGSTLDPYTGELTNDSSSYMKYLREKGIDVSKFVNIPKSAEEQKEHEELGQSRKELDWFKSLSPDYKSKYIGRGHQLTNEQFDYLWQNKFNSLLTQYVKTGLKLNDYQVDKIASNRDLRDNYLHNRIIANQNHKDLTKKEYSLFSPKQKESYYGNMNDDKKLETAIKLNELDIVRYLVEKGVPISDSIFNYALESGNLELVEYLVKKGAKIRDSAVSNAAKSGNLAIVKHLIDEKGAKIDNYAVENAARSGNLDLVKYFLDEKGVKIKDQEEFTVNTQRKSDSITYGAAESGNLALVKYLVEEKSLKINIYNIIKIPNVNLDILEYLIDEKGEKIYSDVIYHAMSTDSFMLRSYNFELIEYLVKKLKEKGIKMDKKTVSIAVPSGNLALVKHLVENGAKIDDNALGHAVISSNLDIVKYLVEKGAKIKDSVIEMAERYNNNAIIDYLNSVRNKN
jgi:diphthamide synthase (EF-2-diphthine--ammonia ligase)